MKPLSKFAYADYAYDDDLAQHASTFLSMLRTTPHKSSEVLDVDLFINSELGKLWASHQFRNAVNAKWGDYGYIRRDQGAETYVRLGHIYDLVAPTGKISTFCLNRYSGQNWEPAKDYPWPETVVR